MHLSNAMKRNSISEPDIRKLLGDAKQRTEQRELALELLLEILRESRRAAGPALRGQCLVEHAKVTGALAQVN